MTSKNGLALDALCRRRLVLMSGKGGVGRSTVSASVAMAAAARGRRVLLCEIEEPAMQARSPLAQKFGRHVFPHGEPAPLGERLWGGRLETERGTELFLSSVFRVPALARLALRTQALRNLLHAAPSFREMGIFYHLLSFLADEARRFDLIILDMPATGHALALTGLPELILRLVPDGPIARDMRQGQAFVADPERTAAFVVTLPETLPVSESLELVEGLEETSVPVGGLIMNRVPVDPFAPDERAVLPELLDGREVLGAAEVARLGRAQQAIDRARQRASRLPLLCLSERAEPEAEVATALARELGELAA